MTELLKKEKKFVWTEICERSFQELKRRLTTQNASGAGQIANPLGHPAPLAHIFQHSSPLAEAVICGLAHTARTAHTAHIASISPIAQSSRSTAAVVSAALRSAAAMENPNSIPPASPLSIVTIPPRALPPSLSSVAVAVAVPMIVHMIT